MESVITLLNAYFIMLNVINDSILKDQLAPWGSDRDARAWCMGVESTVHCKTNCKVYAAAHPKVYSKGVTFRSLCTTILVRLYTVYRVYIHLGPFV